MAEPPDPLRSDVADLLAAIERAAGDLALAEEPARFVAALEGAAPPDGEAPGRC